MKEQFDLIRNIIIKVKGYDPLLKSRKREIADAKKLFIKTAYYYNRNLTLQRVADYLSLNHATILWHKKIADNLLDYDAEFKNYYKEIKEEVFYLKKDFVKKELETEIELTQIKLKKLLERQSEFAI